MNVPLFSLFYTSHKHQTVFLFFALSSSHRERTHIPWLFLLYSSYKERTHPMTFTQEGISETSGVGLWQLQFKKTGEQFTWTGQPVPVHRNWTGTPVPVPGSWTVWPVHQKKNWFKLKSKWVSKSSFHQFFFWWTGQTVQLPGTGTGVPVQFLWTGTGWPVHVNCSPVLLNWSCHSPNYNRRSRVLGKQVYEIFSQKRIIEYLW